MPDVLFTIVKAFDKESGVPIGTTVHSTRSEEDNICKVVTVVQKEKVLVMKTGREHSQIRNFAAKTF